jgi:release factor glutamine methyltransferase
MHIDRPSLRFALDEAQKVLAGGPHPERARRDAEMLLLHVLKNLAAESNLDANVAWLIAHDGETLAADAAATFCDLIKRRATGEPIQYITGEAEFYGLVFRVNRDVLIPRPETEGLVEKAMELAEKLRLSDGSPDARTLSGRVPGLRVPSVRIPSLRISVRTPGVRILDVGTGSGAIAVALAHALPFARIVATDISPAALAVAEWNAARNGCADRVRFFEGDLLEPVAGEHFDIVVSNPPYVPASNRDTLDVEVRDYEPAQALFAGDDGLDIYRRLIPAAFGALVPGGFLVLEIGYGQREGVQALLEGAGFSGVEFTEDLQKIPRVVVGRRS